MTQARPHPDLWQPIAQLLAALRALLRVTSPHTFAAIALDARAHLAALTALVRRYIHVLAAEITLPPLRPPAPPDPDPANPGTRGARRYRFPLIERAVPRRAASKGEDPPELQWALLVEAAGRLAEVLANPAPHARRLACALRRWPGEPLRELPVRWSVLRRVGPGIDTLLIRLDQAARPHAWAGLDTS